MDDRKKETLQGQTGDKSRQRNSPLTTQIVAPPADGVALVSALVGVGGDGGAETLAVAALVAGTRVVDAALHVLGVVHHRVAGSEQV